MSRYEDIIAHNVSIDIIKIISDIYYGKSIESVEFRAKYGSNGAVDKIINTIADKYLLNS